MEVNNPINPAPQETSNPAQPGYPTYQTEPCPPKGSIYEPISVGRYMLLMLIAAIPVVNIIVYIIWAISEHNINIRNYAKAALAWIVIGMVLFFVIWFAFFASVYSLSELTSDY